MGQLIFCIHFVFVGLPLDGSTCWNLIYIRMAKEQENLAGYLECFFKVACKNANLAVKGLKTSANKSSRCSMTIRNAITMERKPQKLYQLAHGRQSLRCSDSQLSRSSSGKYSFSSGSKTSSSSNNHEKERSSLKVPCPPRAMNGRHSRAALAFLVFLPSGGSLSRVRVTLPPPPTCVAVTSRILFLHLWACQGSGTLRRSGQDAEERHLGTGRSSKPSLLESSVCGTIWFGGACGVGGGEEEMCGIP